MPDASRSFSRRAREAVHPRYALSLGARVLDDGRCAFELWAPKADAVEVHLYAPHARQLPMTPGKDGYFRLITDQAPAGSRYKYVLDGRHAFPDPVSRFQPDGVHEPSEVVDSRFDWHDEHWRGLRLDDYIIYELHVGTFTGEGTFDAAISHLDRLQDLGVTAIELMPVNQFPGHRNWGYDGVYLFAPQNTYGGPAGLKRFVNACHARGFAVILDVVYNHLGPEGNYLDQFGHYFTNRHRTPWGEALNFDGPHSDEVRRFFLENALSWVVEFHIDALRLDAVQAIHDESARPFLRELADALHDQGEYSGRRVYAIAESNLNDPRLIRPKQLGGCDLDGQWVDDFHHSLHQTLTGERTGYYADFTRFDDLVTSYRDGFVYTGQYSRYRGRRHGAAAHELPASSFVVYAQNHDQVGNRLQGDRLGQLVSFEQAKLAAAAILLSPYIPLLFMGEEYGETAPFPFFCSFLDPALAEAVRRGRKKEFAAFRWAGEPPDPQHEATFLRSRLDHSLKSAGRHRVLWNYYRTLIELRTGNPALALLSKEHMRVDRLSPEPLIAIHRWAKCQDALTLLHFGDAERTVTVAAPAGHWTARLDSADTCWDGPGSRLPESFESHGEVALTIAPRSVVLLTRKEHV